MANATNVPAFKVGSGKNIVPDQLRCTGPIFATGSTPQTIDLSAEQQNVANFIDQALTAYVDNGGNANAAFLQFDTGQQINIPPDTQGYYPILCRNPPRFSFYINGAGTAYLQLINALLPANTWAASAL